MSVAWVCWVMVYGMKLQAIRHPAHPACMHATCSSAPWLLACINAIAGLTHPSCCAVCSWLQLPGPALDPRVPLLPPVPPAPLRPSLKARMSGAGSLPPSGSVAPPGPPFLPPGPPQPTYDAGRPSGRRGLVVGSAEWEMEVRMDRERARLAEDRLAAGGGGSGSRKKRRSKGRRKGRGARDERSLR